MFRKIKNFISSGLLIAAVAFLFLGTAPQMSYSKWVHSYVKVTESDGTIWVYEYDEDGNLVNVFPDLD
jgi:hypothetical protein